MMLIWVKKLDLQPRTGLKALKAVLEKFFYALALRKHPMVADETDDIVNLLDCWMDQVWSKGEISNSVKGGSLHDVGLR